VNPRDPILFLRSAFDRILILLFLASIAVPGVLMLFTLRPDDDTLVEERREQVPFPAVSADPTSVAAFPEAFEKFFEDRFGLRNLLIRGYSLMKWNILHSSISPKVVVGKDGWLFFNGDPAIGDSNPITDYRGIDPLELYELEWLRWMFDGQTRWLQENGMKFLLVVLPSKTGIYPEYLPSKYTRTGSPRWREQFVSYLQENSEVPILDAGPSILEASETNRVFMKSDTHWNDLGAYQTYRDIVEALTPWFPDMKSIPQSSFDTLEREEDGGDLARLLHLDDIIRERQFRLIPRFTLQSPNRPESDHPRARVFGGTGNNDHPTAYVYRDSFTANLIPMLSELFREVEYEWGQGGAKMVGIEERNPDVVLQIVGDRILKAPLTYAPRMQRFAAKERFERAAGNVLFKLSSETGWQSAVPVMRCTATEVEQGLKIVTTESGARLQLPAISNIETVLPVLRIDIRAPQYSVLGILGEMDSGTAGRQGKVIGLGREPLEQGRNTKYVSLVDPRSTGPIILDLGAATGAFGIYSLEIRGLPRHSE
jgi:hypothetical protein